MNDREMLELAAKAAGFGGKEQKFCWTESEYPRGAGVHGALWNYIGHMDTAELWNPLTDDGDALRLAINCNLTVCMDGKKTASACRAYLGNDGEFVTEFFDGEINKAETTRRAIVRAAAEIGKNMQ